MGSGQLNMYYCYYFFFLIGAFLSTHDAPAWSPGCVFSRACKIVISAFFASSFVRNNISQWDVKQATPYSRRIEGEVAGVAAVVISPAEVAGLAVMSLKGLW